MLKKILIGVAVVAAVLAAVIATRPSEFKVQRSATISAPAPVVFGLVNDFRKWGQWSPYEKLDPAMKKTYEGQPAGIGSIYTWAGNSQAGEGRATIVDSKPSELIRIRLDFEKPFPGTAHATFTFKTEGEKTQVTWALDGTNNFLAKAIHLVLDMDKMVGGQFEEGLADLSRAAGAAAKS